jgi:hypothetical protein
VLKINTCRYSILYFFLICTQLFHSIQFTVRKKKQTTNQIITFVLQTGSNFQRLLTTFWKKALSHSSLNHRPPPYPKIVMLFMDDLRWTFIFFKFCWKNKYKNQKNCYSIKAFERGAKKGLFANWIEIIGFVSRTKYNSFTLFWFGQIYFPKFR